MARSPRRPALPRLPLHTLVCVTWDDAAFDVDKAEEVLPLQTVGWLTRCDRVAVVVAGEANVPRTYFRAYTTIPRGMVRRIVPLADTVADTVADTGER